MVTIKPPPNDRNISTQYIPTLLGATCCCYLVMRRFPTTSAALKSLGFVTYALFYIWQVIGLILYNIRAFQTSFVAKHTSFQSTQNQTFHHSQQLQLACWSMSKKLTMTTMPCLFWLCQKFPLFWVGPSLLIRLLGFWSLLSLFAMTIAGYGMALSLGTTKMEIALIMASSQTKRNRNPRGRWWMNLLWV